jgi:hypothetical protein
MHLVLTSNNTVDSPLEPSYSDYGVRYYESPLQLWNSPRHDMETDAIMRV